MREEETEKLRGVVRDCVSKHLYSSAIFFADKVAAFTNDPADTTTELTQLEHYSPPPGPRDSLMSPVNPLFPVASSYKCRSLRTSSEPLGPKPFMVVLVDPKETRFPLAPLPSQCFSLTSAFPSRLSSPEDRPRYEDWSSSLISF